jgi:VIT1/CCC1 family predicted Fe2+/Mn2+ transporter
MRHREWHRTDRIGWLRAAVLGANDGIVSTASLVVGVAAADTSRQGILLAGIAGLVAGAFSMAAGEYVSVSSQADTEQADLALERSELANQPEAEENELTAIYVKRGLEPELARKVAQQLAAHDALGAHARDELGLSDMVAAQPIQAALASAGTFAVGAGLPILTVVFAPQGSMVMMVSATSLGFGFLPAFAFFGHGVQQDRAIAGAKIKSLQRQAHRMPSTQATAQRRFGLLIKAWRKRRKSTTPPRVARSHNSSV